jgi:hypothetical protein
MHRPGIARVIGDRIVLDGTTIDEVERYHSATLQLAVDEANRLERENEKKSKRLIAADLRKREQQLRHVAEVARRLKFGS